MEGLPAPALHVCAHYAEDVAACLREMGHAGLQVVAYPARCGRPPLGPKDLDLRGRDWILGGCCLADLGNAVPGIHLCRLRNCQHMLLEAQELEVLLNRGAYVLTSGWLREWRRHLAEWGGDPETVRDLMRESATCLVCLDTGTGPADLEGEMASLGEALGLPWSIQRVGRERMKAFLEERVMSLLKELAVSTDSELVAAHRQAADRAVALEFLGELSQSLLESEVLERAASFFGMLFGASTVRFHPAQAGLGEGEDYRDLEDGFLVRLGQPGQRVGTLEVAGLAFPQYKGYYLNLALSVAGVCALAVLNARTYRALQDSQASQRLMLDVLDAFFRFKELPEGLDAALAHIQAYTGVDAVAVRLDRHEGQAVFTRGFPPELEPPGGNGSGAPCGGLEALSRLGGPFPPGLGGRTDRGSVWTADLPELLASLSPPDREACRSALALAETFRTLVLVPIHSGPVVLGLLQVCQRRPRRFSSRLLDLLEGVAGSIALVLERRFAEGRLREMNQDLESRVRQRTTELATMNQSLMEEIRQRSEVEKAKAQVELQLLQSQKLEAIGTMVGGIAHDFNNILTPILGLAELGLRKSGDAGPFRRDFDLILKAGERARDLVNQLLLFSRRQEQERKNLLLAPVLKEALKLLRAALPATIQFQVHLDAEDARVLANPTQIHQILMNLCTNAGHAMEVGGGVLRVDLARTRVEAGDPLATLIPPGPYVVLQVADTGCGMTKEVQERIFEPFFTTKGPGQGTGLGLSVVHGLVASFGGHVGVQSEVGRGTVFQVHLPEQRESPPAEPADEAATGALTGHERVLILDDDQVARQTLLRFLEELGYAVTAESEGAAALARLQRDPGAFDLVMTDMTLPGMTGLEFAEHIQILRPDLPIVLCSGYHQGLVQARMRQAGIRAFLQKPYQLEQMARTLRRVLSAG
jgi:signal transduction histidine kinase/CheY-like chemotaxis protein